jgi:hypothetical protein
MLLVMTKRFTEYLIPNEMASSWKMKNGGGPYHHAQKNLAQHFRILVHIC